MIGPADRGTVGATTGAVVGAARPAALNTGVPMAERSEVVDEGFLRRYRELLDQEAAAFDELEHSYEDGDRAHYERELAQWRSIVERKMTFLDRRGLVPLPSRA